MKQLVALSLLFGIWLLSIKCCIAHGRELPEPPYKIAIIDTGYDTNRVNVPTLKLCSRGHYDYFTNTENLNYVSQHGTWVGNIIATKLQRVDYCSVIYQVSPSGSDVKRLLIPTTNIADAVNRAIGEGVVAINISLASENEEDGRPDAAERQAIKWASDAGILIFISAGNRHIDLDKKCSVYPACYRGIKNMIVVGATSEDDKKKPSLDSNYGKVVNVWAQGFYEDGDIVETGTSFAAPRALSEYVLFLDYQRAKKK